MKPGAHPQVSLSGNLAAGVNVGVGRGQVITVACLVVVTVTRDPGSVVTCPGKVTVVVMVLVEAGNVMVVNSPAAVVVVTIPGKIVMIVSTEVMPGKVTVIGGAVMVAPGTKSIIQQLML
jgi:hypothetical protein